MSSLTAYLKTDLERLRDHALELRSGCMHVMATLTPEDFKRGLEIFGTANIPFTVSQFITTSYVTMIPQRFNVE